MGTLFVPMGTFFVPVGTFFVPKNKVAIEAKVSKIK